MDNTVTQIAGPQAGQLVASRYRLASFHRGDGSTEVWRAPDATVPTVETSLVPEAATGDHGLSLLLYALRSRELSLIDQALLEESMIEFLDLAVAEFKAVRLDPDLLPDARSFAVSLLTAGPRGLASAVGRIATFRPHVRVRAPRMSQPKQPKPPKQPKQPKVSAPRMKETAVAAAKPM